jgi:hypothetical protein
MKVRLTCTYQNAKGETIGKYHDVLESPRDASAEELKRLVASGSAVEVEPPTNSERD